MQFNQQIQRVIATALAATVALLVVTLAMLTFPSAGQATPALAKGKPCGTCHSGSPPSKSNVKR